MLNNVHRRSRTSFLLPLHDFGTHEAQTIAASFSISLHLSEGKQWMLRPIFYQTKSLISSRAESVSTGAPSSDEGELDEDDDEGAEEHVRVDEDNDVDSHEGDPDDDQEHIVVVKDEPSPSSAIPEPPGDFDKNKSVTRLAGEGGGVLDVVKAKDEVEGARGGGKEGGDTKEGKPMTKKKKFGELELSLQRNVEIPETRLTIHPVIRRAVGQNAEIPETHLTIHPVIQRAVEQAQAAGARPILSQIPSKTLNNPSGTTSQEINETFDHLFTFRARDDQIKEFTNIAWDVTRKRPWLSPLLSSLSMKPLLSSNETTALETLLLLDESSLPPPPTTTSDDNVIDADTRSYPTETRTSLLLLSLASFKTLSSRRKRRVLKPRLKAVVLLLQPSLYISLEPLTLSPRPSIEQLSILIVFEAFELLT
ncbi:hypothetical protein EV361DRAFT_873815 [Lentinula raphanica]|nr:hypothetical protein F5880DRAFT_1511227 [Lentinula raphanica]KAJ3964671.1 hypothetical protein EV361DRAFT_873815 [Lentinula raphanica]